MDMMRIKEICSQLASLANEMKGMMSDGEEPMEPMSEEEEAPAPLPASGAPRDEGYQEKSAPKGKVGIMLALMKKGKGKSEAAEKK